LLDMLAFSEQDGFKLAVDLWPDTDGKGGLHRTEASEVDRQIAFCRGRRGYRNSSRRRRTRRANRRRPLMQGPYSRAANPDRNGAIQKHASSATHAYLLGRPPHAASRGRHFIFISLPN